MPIIKPITELRDTTKISSLVENSNEPIFITKNGYLDFVLLNKHLYEMGETKKEDLIVNKYVNNIEFEPIDNSSYGFIKVCAPSVKTTLGNVKANSKAIFDSVLKNEAKGVKVMVFGELSLTGYSLRDLFFRNELLEETQEELANLANKSKGHEVLFVVGAPISHNNSIYNCAVVIFNGEILGVVPKTFIPNYNEFYEGRQFAPALKGNSKIYIYNKFYPFGTELLFTNTKYKDLKIAIEICEDLWVPNTPSTEACLNGATLVLNLSASNELVSKPEYRLDLVKMTSAREISCYVYSSQGEGESTTDVVYGGHKIIAVNGSIIAESKPFTYEDIIEDIDLEKLVNNRRKMSTFRTHHDRYELIPFSLSMSSFKLESFIEPHPYLINDPKIAADRYRYILKIQAYGLKARLEAVNGRKVLVGLSGGLDSTLALLVCKECFDMLSWDSKGIYAITLPCFGTSKRTHDNAVKLSKELNVTFKEINIKDAVSQHLKDIEHNPDIHDVTYENAQARERTQVLFDYSNEIGALLVGTGDLSELCLGWCTYNGDHMSSYGVNASIPKTLVIELVNRYALDHETCKDTLLDIINTPISPELLPPTNNGEISQITEDNVGPYELHDFFIYHFLKHNFSPKKILFLASRAFKGKYDKEEIKRVLVIFLRRFYTSQFKRSCLPDGIKVGSASISPRGDLRMPSDISPKAILTSLEE